MLGEMLIWEDKSWMVIGIWIPKSKVNAATSFASDVRSWTGVNGSKLEYQGFTGTRNGKGAGYHWKITIPRLEKLNFVSFLRTFCEVHELKLADLKD
mgnify:CR=1 FL=1